MTTQQEGPPSATGGAPGEPPAAPAPPRAARTWFPRHTIDAASMIALAAFIFSLANAVFAYCQLQSDQATAARSELNSVVERLGALERDATSLNRECADPDISPQLLAVCQQAALSFQAERRALVEIGRDLANEIGDNVNSSDYRSLALAVSALSDNSGADELLDRAVEVARDVQDRVAALQLKANVAFAIDAETARETYRKALSAIDEGSFRLEIDRTLLKSQVLQTWINNESAIGSCEEAADLFPQFTEAARGVPKAVRVSLLGVDIPDDPDTDPEREDFIERCEANRG